MHRQSIYIGALLLLLLPPLAQAELGYPLVAFINGDDGSTSYESNTGTFSVDATPLAVQLEDGAVPILISGGTFSISIVLDPLRQPVSGSIVVTGTVDLGGLGFFSGDLMTGHIASYEATDTGTSTDLYDMHFVPTGGQLLFALGGNNIGVELTSEESDFAGDFGVDFGGKAKGTLGTQPTTPGDCDDDSSDDDSSDDDSSDHDSDDDSSDHDSDDDSSDDDSSDHDSDDDSSDHDSDDGSSDDDSSDHDSDDDSSDHNSDDDSSDDDSSDDACDDDSSDDDSSDDDSSDDDSSDHDSDDDSSDHDSDDDSSDHDSDDNSSDDDSSDHESDDDSSDDADGHRGHMRGTKPIKPKKPKKHSD